VADMSRESHESKDRALRLGAKMGPAPVVCPGCHNEIDPEVCWCGNEIERHSPQWDGHNPVPLGCDCGRAKEKP
jgi:hypothetical protein